MGEQTSLSVMSWNLWWRFGPWQDRAPAIAATLQRENPDIICLQEVWDDGARNLAAELAQGLGYHHAYAPGARPNGIHMGNAILSRWPIASHDIIALHDQKGAEEMRVAIRAEIDGPTGMIPVFCTHLNYLPYHSAIRQKQVADLLGFIKQSPRGALPPILCGDFNADPMSDEIRMITGLAAAPVPGIALFDSWAWCHPGTLGLTWSRENPYAAENPEPQGRIDYVFAGRANASGAGRILACRITGDAPVQGIWPSDHFAVLTEFQT